MSDRGTSSREVARRCLESPEFPATEAATPRVLIGCDDPEFAADGAQAGAARGLIVESFCTAAAAVRRLTEKLFTPTGDTHVIRFPTSPPAFTHCIALQDGNEALAFLLNGKAPRDAVIVFDRDLAGIDTRDAVRRLASAEGQKPLSFPLFAARVERLLTVP